ncbi:hypothetical protein [Agrococcus jejuensis]|uniref:Uncharacterized protein n=1 Tax=Agrococcus jejuensis TaxID=399736 RepID=A0A1G8CD75_9MICO|nr:hypothetical protein [Agrococcus jejuensis]SDH43461.1 hypothetical protein SAMN04489720_1250 [Agrococcus jejuensis]
MQTPTAAHLATARTLGVRAGLRGDPSLALSVAALWALVVTSDVGDVERSAPRRLHAAYRQGSQACRLELATASSVAA